MGGADVEQVRRQLGHASLNLIPLYVHNVEGLRNTAADMIDLDILSFKAKIGFAERFVT
jgi:hypothetical protein